MRCRMQIVIDIPDILMEYIVKGRDLSEEQNDEMAYAIADGTPLPKGHGRLIDADAMFKDICNSIEEMTNIGIVVGRQYLWEKINDAIYNAPTIIKADTERNRNDTD